MTSRLRITVRDLHDATHAEALRAAMDAQVAELRAAYPELDLSRLHEICVTGDFPTVMAELGERVGTGTPITYTDQRSALAVAKVITLPDGDDVAIQPVVNADVAAWLREDGGQRHALARHAVHHELCHVHDINAKARMAEPVVPTAYISGVDQFTRPLADRLWSEYVASRLSAPTLPDQNLEMVCDELAEAVAGTPGTVDRLRAAYRQTQDVPEFMRGFQQHGEAPLRTAAYVLGYADGLGLDVGEQRPDTATALGESWFAGPWRKLANHLRLLYRVYPDWGGVRMIKPIQDVIESYYEMMGVQLDEGPNASVRVLVL
jgi:hypothetical protein